MKKLRICLMALCIVLMFCGITFATSAMEGDSIKAYENVAAEINERYDLGFRFAENGAINIRKDMTVDEFRAWLTELAIANQRAREHAEASIAQNSEGVSAIMPLAEEDYYRGSDGTVVISCTIRYTSSGGKNCVTNVLNISSTNATSSKRFTQQSFGYSTTNNDQTAIVWVQGLLTLVNSYSVPTGYIENSYHQCSFNL